MKLTDRKWNKFLVSDICDSIIQSSGDNQAKLLNEGNTPLISAGTTSQGIVKFIDHGDGISKIIKGHVVTVDMFGNAYVHLYDFYSVSHGRVCILCFDKSISDEVLFFFALAFEISSSGKYSYSRMCSLQRLSQQHIMLPITKSGKPDFQFMEDYIKELIKKKKAQYRSYAENMIKSIDEVCDLGSKKWHSFVISDIFEIKPGKRLVAAASTEGERPFIGALDNNNGVARFVSDDNVSKDKNVLGVNYNGNGMVIGFYHPYECIFSDDVKRFHLKHYPDNEYVLLFMKALILKQKSKFGYLYKFNADRMAHTSIMIPVDDNGNPDYAFMEKYGKMLVARKYKQYLDYLGSNSKD